MRHIIILFYLFVISVSCFADEKVDSKSLIVFENGKHGPMKFMVTITPDGRIEDLTLLESKEVKEAKINRKRFLRQFIGKTSEDPIKLGKDINAVTGATISSRATAKAVRKALMIWRGSNQNK